MKQIMKKNKLPARILSGALILVLMVSLCPTVFAAEGSVTIGTLKELKDFSKQCASDSYSKGLSAVLTADIDADGAAISIPVFLGSFDGQGHTITGLSLTESNSAYGLFSRIENDAVVKDLTVEGEVTPSGTQNVVGGIAGENYGTIENCSFSGIVAGSGSVGGIAGSNGGTITGCSVSGVVRGTQYTGGIAGQNSGSLLRCENTAAVNTTVRDEDLASAGISGLENTFYSILKKEDTTENAITTDTGGIAGFSTGVVQSCTNTGPVGYPHVGYNVGGIAGRQSGYLVSCVNRGEIQGRKDVGGVVGQMVPDITLKAGRDRMAELLRELEKLSALTEQTGNDMLDMSDAAAGRMERIEDRSTHAEETMEDLLQKPDGDMTPEELAAWKEKLEKGSQEILADLSGINDELSAMPGDVKQGSNALREDLRALSQQYSVTMTLFFELADEVMYPSGDVYEDVSEESLQSAASGKAWMCANYGAVTADRNAGGIAGAMAIEYDTDPEDDLRPAGSSTAQYTYQTKAILLECNNYGAVQAKKSCAGGIAGRMDLGIVSGCGGWGSVASESGDYVGGAAGLSLSSVRSSYAKCTLSGGKYVGGIVGSGSRVSDCISMVQITDHTQFGGAIAGEITGEYSNNRFVSDTLAGVDRVSYSGKAEQIGYDELCAIENIPENFLHLTLRFVAEDTVLHEQEFAYGASFTEDIYPEIPAKDDCYGQWDTTDLTDLHFDTVVTVNYEPYVTTLASEAQSDGHAEVLAEGRFRKGDRLRMEKSALLIPGQEEQVNTWTITVPDDGQSSHIIRWLIPTDETRSYTIYAMQADGWHKVDSEQIGGYLRFALDGDGQFAVVPAEHTAWWIWILAGVGSIGTVGAILLLVRRRKVRK